MGFLSTLREEVPDAYRPYYLRYEQLRELVVELPGEKRTRHRLESRELMDVDAQPVGRFQELLQVELKKVNQFACVKHEALFLGIRRICEDCKSLGKRVPPQERPKELQNMKERIEDMSREIVHLDTYVRLNYLGFQKLTWKFDRSHGISGSALFLGGLHSEPFCNVRFDDILILLGLAWSRWRAASSSAEQAKDATWKPPESFIRNTAKYWVRPDRVVLLKTRILEHLPYLIFGASMVEQEKLLEPFALLDLDYAGVDEKSQLGAYSGTLEESQLLSSVYFDSPEGVCYFERIRREEGARLVRFRWYGENNLEDDKEIYIERKIHHEGWGSASSAKERSILPQSDVFDFMKGRFDIDGFYAKLEADGVYSAKTRKAMKLISHEVNTMIQEKRLQPILRTSYYRCAFQLSTSNEVRISLDTQMSLLNEFVEGGHQQKPWCHISSDILGKEEVYRFPFAILEIKLQNVSETPLWLRQTLADIGATQVHKFSKFQHGMAFLHPDKVAMLPHWHQDFQEWHERRSHHTGREKRSSSSSNESIEDLTVPRLVATVAPEGEGHFLKDMQNLDPKAVFANERTLLHYAEKGLYSGALAVALMHVPGVSTLAGLVLATCTGCFYIWILGEYYSRLARITGRAAVVKDKSSLRLDLAHGPLMAASLVGLVLVLSLFKALEGSGGEAG